MLLRRAPLLWFRMGLILSTPKDMDIKVATVLLEKAIAMIRKHGSPRMNRCFEQIKGGEAAIKIPREVSIESLSEIYRTRYDMVRKGIIPATAVALKELSEALSNSWESVGLMFCIITEESEYILVSDSRMNELIAEWENVGYTVKDFISEKPSIVGRLAILRGYLFDGLQYVGSVVW
jgi:hypothetical protein